MTNGNDIIAYIEIPFKQEWEEPTGQILGRATFPDVNVYSELDKPFVQLTGSHVGLSRLLNYVRSADSAVVTRYSRADPKVRTDYKPARPLSKMPEKQASGILILDIEPHSDRTGRRYTSHTLRDGKCVRRLLLGQSEDHDLCVDVFNQTAEHPIRRFFVFEGNSALWKRLWYKLYTDKAGRVYYSIDLG